MVHAYQGDSSRIVPVKTYTERTLTRLLVGGESWARSYFKPAGYPGDYKIMNFMYDRTLVGASLQAKLLHTLGVVAGQPIVSRMHKLAELIITHSAGAAASGRPVDIMSIGAGPARELEKLAEHSPEGRKWRATLIDQDTDAIEYAISNVRRRGIDRTIETRPLNMTFREMLSPSPLSSEFADKDIIYSSGFVDYLNPMLAMRFVKRLYEFLRPGGSIIIGNVNDLRTGTLWPMEYILDWTLYFRNLDEMTAMAQMVKGAKVDVVSDDMEAIYLLVITKPAA
jgi:SAM-dependent methyltransferase